MAYYELVNNENCIFKYFIFFNNALKAFKFAAILVHHSHQSSSVLRWPTRDMLQTKKKRCKQKRNAANKKSTLQIKKKRCKQKRNAANKKCTLQIKKVRCKQKRNAANKKITLQIKKYAANKKTYAANKNERCK